jgi:hypothetical protein
VVLSDPTGTFGVKRTDTNAVVVADSTALTNVSTGVYRYTFTDPAPGLTYNYYVEWVYGGETYRVERTISGETIADTTGRLTVAQARALLLQFAANKGETSLYNTTAQDNALMALGDDLVVFGECTLRVDSLILAADSDVLPALPSRFAPHRLRSAWLVSTNVTIETADESAALQPVDFDQLHKMSILEAEEGQPTQIAFDSLTSGRVYPKPTENYTLKIRWLEPFTTWTAGDSGAAATILNVPEELLRQAIMTGGVYMLHKNMPNSKYARESFAAYQRFLMSIKDKGYGSLGGRVTQSRPRW